MARLLCYVVVLVSGSNWSHHAAPCHLLPLRGTSNFHFFPVHPVFGSNDSSRWRGVLSSSLPFISLSTQQSTLRASPCACLPALLVRSSSRLPPSSRGDRPVSAGPIGKQRPKMCFPISFSSSTSKHSNRPRRKERCNFLLTMIFIATVPCPPP